MENQPSLQKTCSVCGQRKPLSAFLEISGKQPHFGNVCSTCRKASTKTEAHDAEDGTRRSVGGTRFGAEELAAQEIEKKEEKQKIRDEYDEERKNEADIQLSRGERAKIKEAEARRRDAISAKQLFVQKKPPVDMDKTYEAELAKEAEIDLSAPVEDTRVVKEKRRSSSVWSQFQSWVPGVAPVKKEPNKDVKEGVARKFQTFTPAKEQEAKAGEQQKEEARSRKDIVIDHIEENFPKSGPGRKF